MLSPLVAAGGSLAILLLPWLAWAGAPTTDGQDIQRSEQQLQQVKKRITQLQHELQSSEQQYQALLRELRDTEQRIGETAHRLHIVGGQLAQQRAALSGLEQKRRRQQNELQQQRQALVRQLRSAYAMGRQERLKILLNQQDPAIVSRVLVYYDYFNRARTAQIEQIDQVLKDLRQTETVIQEEQQRLSALQRNELAEQAQLQQNQQSRQAVVAALGSDIQGKGEQLQALKQDAQQLQQLLDRLQLELVSLPLLDAGREPIEQRKGRLDWPTKGRLKALFGTAKGGNLNWDGVLIAAAEGSVVQAVHHGRVAFADWLRGFGLLLIIDHGAGYMTLYGHNQSLFKETGEWVEAGEAVSLVGNSGGQSDAGVYFGIRYNGKAVNPKRWCRKPRGRRVGRWQMTEPGLAALETAGNKV